MLKANDYIPVRCRLFIRRAADALGVKRCMVVGVLLDDMGLELDDECIVDAGLQLHVAGERDTGRMFRGHRVDQVLTSSEFNQPLEEIKPPSETGHDSPKNGPQPDKLDRRARAR
jgi:hypothetical protein